MHSPQRRHGLGPPRCRGLPALLHAVLLAVLTAALWPVPAARAAPFALDPGMGVGDVRGYADVLRDPAGNWTPADILARQALFRPVATLVPDPEVNALHPGTLWFRLQPRSTDPGPWFMNVMPFLDRAELVFVAADGEVSRVAFGNMMPQSRYRPDVPNTRARLPDGAVRGGTLYLRTTGATDRFGAFAIRPAIWVATSGQAVDDAHVLPELVLIGLIGGLGLFNGVLGIMLRERIYLRYSLAMGCFAVYLAADCEVAWSWIWPSLSLSYPITVGGLYCLYLLLVISFARRFLDPGGLDRIWWRLVQGLWVVEAAFTALNTVDPNLLARAGLAAPLAPLLSGLVLCAILASGIAPWRRGQAGAGAYMLAFAGVACGLPVEILANQDVIAMSAWTDAAPGLGVAWEALLLAVAVGERVLRLRSERDQLAALAVHDGLTALPNRRALDQRLADEWRRALRTHSRIGVVMIDVDCFKPYNDSFGHLAGDAVLVQVAGAARRALERGEDFLARYGGEEFVAVLPRASEADALAAAGRIRAAVEALGLAHAASPLGQVTVSAGVASTYPSHGGNALALLHAADGALYQAKRAGRNRAVLACADAADCGRPDQPLTGLAMAEPPDREAEPALPCNGGTILA